MLFRSIWNKAIQTDAKISPQNYGGPLIDLEGKVMGILTPINPGIATEGEVEQWYDSGIGFAIPFNDIMERLPKMQAGEDIYPGRLGIRGQGGDEYSKELVLQGITPGSPAAKGGLAVGDKIVAAGTDLNTLKKVGNNSEFKHTIGALDAGQKIALAIERSGNRKEIECVLVRDIPTYREAYLGLLIDPASNPVEPKVSGLLPESPAKAAGVGIGWILESIDGEPLSEKSDLQNRIANLDYRDSVKIGFRTPEGEQKSISIPLKSRPEKDLEWDYRLTIAEEPVNQNPKEAAPEVGTIQIPLGDVTNKAFAIVPSTYSERMPHGLMVIYADAGEQNQAEWSEAWEPFAREHRWIIAVAQSAGEKGWNFEEVEIGTRVQN